MPHDKQPGHSHQGHEHHDHDEHDPNDPMDECIEQCLQAHVVCTMTAQYSLAQGGDHADVGHIGLMLDCAEICQTSANFMVRGSPFHELTCSACAEICSATAASCRTLGDDEHLAHCAEVLDACAASCAAMASGAGGMEDDDEEEEDEDEE